METTAEQKAVIAVLETNDGVFRPGFREWFSANLVLWADFERKANRVIQSGRKHYLANRIIKYLRHCTLRNDSTSEFKCDGHWCSSMAKLYALWNPADRNLFVFRQRANSVVGSIEVAA